MITREQAKDLRNAFECWQQDYDPAADKEQYEMFGLGVVAMDVLLASLDAGSNSHLAHGPLSNDRLHRISDILRKAAAQSDGGNIGYAMSDAVRAFDELLAGRKSEPVAWSAKDVRNGDQSLYSLIDDVNAALSDNQWLEITPLYAAAPSPVTIDERAAFNAWNNEDNLPIAGVGAKNAAWLAWQARAKLGSPTAPVVPDEVMPGGLVYSSALPKFESSDSDKVVGYCCFISGETRIVESQEQAYADARSVVNACRAAMLNGGKS